MGCGQFLKAKTDLLAAAKKEPRSSKGGSDAVAAVERMGSPLASHGEEGIKCSCFNSGMLCPQTN